MTTFDKVVLRHLINPRGQIKVAVPPLPKKEKATKP